MKRRAIQLGLAGDVVSGLWNTDECIVNITDITEFVETQRNRLDGPVGWRVDPDFLVPVEQPYELMDEHLSDLIGCSTTADDE